MRTIAQQRLRPRRRLQQLIGLGSRCGFGNRVCDSLAGGDAGSPAQLGSSRPLPYGRGWLRAWAGSPCYVGTECGPAKSRPTKNPGFTLLELIIVIAIIGLLAALVLPNVFSAGEQAKIKTTLAQMSALGTAVEEFRSAIGRYPSAEEGLAVLVAAPQGMEEWSGPYLRKETLPRDGWGNAFIYKEDEAFGFRIISYGADGRPGGEEIAADLDNRK